MRTWSQLMGAALVVVLSACSGAAPAAPEPHPGAYVPPESDRHLQARQKLERLERRRSARGMAASRRRDEQTTRRIQGQMARSRLLSPRAKQIEVIAREGMVTLRGVVPTQEERAQLLAIARGVAGTGRVEDRLVVVEVPGGP